MTVHAGWFAADTSLYDTLPPTDPDTAHRAALAVAHHSRDAAEAREFLAMLGLLTEESDR